MELEHFIEQDIRIFLDKMRTKDLAPASQTPRRTGVLSPEELEIYSPGRDYTKELHVALQDHEFGKAKRILHELKESYASYPEDAPERIEGHRLLKSLYNTFKKKLAEENPDDFAPEDFEAMDGETRQQETNPVPDPVPEPVIETPVPPPEPDPGMSVTEEKALLAEISHVETLIHEHEYISAISLYQDLKSRLTNAVMSAEQRATFVPKLAQMYNLLHEKIGSGVQEIKVAQPSEKLDSAEKNLVGAP